MYMCHKPLVQIKVVIKHPFLLIIIYYDAEFGVCCWTSMAEYD